MITVTRKVKVPICEFGKALKIKGTILSIDYDFGGTTYDEDDKEQDFVYMEIED